MIYYEIFFWRTTKFIFIVINDYLFWTIFFCIPHYGNAHTILPKMEQNRQKKTLGHNNNNWIVEHSRIEEENGTEFG